MKKRGMLSRVVAFGAALCLSLTLTPLLAGAQAVGETASLETVTSSLGYQLLMPTADFRYLPQLDGDVFWADVTAYDNVPNVYLSVSWLTGYTLSGAQEGLLLQSGLSGAWENASLSGGNAAVLRVQEGTQPTSRVCVYTLYPVSGEKQLLVEYAYFREAEATLGAKLAAMRDSITLTGGGVSQDERVECPNCGLFYAPGEIDAHVCVGK